jgi:hypothetical protein
MTDKELTRRLENLERDNRRLRRVAVAGIALAAALGVIYAASCSSARNAMSGAQKMTAREFDVVDDAGKVRVNIAMNCPSAANCRPEIRLFDQDGNPLTSVGAGTLTVSGKKEAASLQGDRLQFSVGPQGSPPRVTAELGSGTGGGGLLSMVGKEAGYVRVNANSPGIEIQDSQGYTMNLGAVDLTAVNSGQTSRTTADSIVMFGNDNRHHLIWRVP